ncbi:MAG: hypothetical protein WC610_03540 [Patescibacteria group bacterium]
MIKTYKFSNDFKFPHLTQEEISFIRSSDYKYFWNLFSFLPMYRRISVALMALTLVKVVPSYGKIKNIKEAQAHYLKACRFYPPAQKEYDSLKERLLGNQSREAMRERRKNRMLSKIYMKYCL